MKVTNWFFCKNVRYYPAAPTLWFISFIISWFGLCVFQKKKTNTGLYILCSWSGLLPKQMSEPKVKSQTSERKNNFPFDVVTELFIMYNYINLCQKPTLYIHMEIDSLASRMSRIALADLIWRDNWTKFVSRASTSSAGSIAVAKKGEQALGSWDCSSRPAMEARNYEAKCKLGLGTGVMHLDI